MTAAATFDIRQSTADSPATAAATFDSRRPTARRLRQRHSTVDGRQPDDVRRTTIRQPCDIRHATCDKLMAFGPSEVESRMSRQGCRTTTVECPVSGCRTTTVECHGKGRPGPQPFTTTTLFVSLRRNEKIADKEKGKPWIADDKQCHCDVYYDFLETAHCNPPLLNALFPQR